MDEWDFLSASPLSTWNDDVWIQCTDPEYDGDPDDVLANHLGVPIYSSRLRQALDRAGITGIQYLSVRVLHRDGTEIPGYHIANFTNKVKALDLDRSKYTVFGDDYSVVKRRGEIEGVDMAVLKKKPSSASIFSGSRSLFCIQWLQNDLRTHSKGSLHGLFLPKTPVLIETRVRSSPQARGKKIPVRIPWGSLCKGCILRILRLRANDFCWGRFIVAMRSG